MAIALAFELHGVRVQILTCITMKETIVCRKHEINIQQISGKNRNNQQRNTSGCNKIEHLQFHSFIYVSAIQDLRLKKRETIYFMRDVPRQNF